MALSNKHPLYGVHYPDWVTLRHAWQGERVIKENGQLYLPPTNAMMEDGMGLRGPGRQAYEAYKMRAVYHDLVRNATLAMLGIMHRKPAIIEVPATMEPILDRLTFDGEPAQIFLQKMNQDQLVYGRLGLMLDVPDNAPPDTLPYIVQYQAENVYNWDTSKLYDENGERRLQFVILNESTYIRTSSLAWKYQIHYRVLADADALEAYDENGEAQNPFPGVQSELTDSSYVAGNVVQSNEISANMFKTPQLAGRGMPCIPFRFVGPRDMVPEPDVPPMLSIAKLALAIYRGEADYRNCLFKAGQPTLVTVGQMADPTQTLTIGPDSSIDLSLGGDAFYIQGGTEGLQPQADAINNDERRAEKLGANLLDQKGADAESGDALKLRSAARTSSLTTVATTGGEALKQMLQWACIWKGADPDKVEVHPNLDFEDGGAVPLDLVNLVSAKNLGAPISKKSVHGWMGRQGFTVLTYEEEQEQIEKEGPPDQLGTSGLAGLPGGMNTAPKAQGLVPGMGKQPGPSAAPKEPKSKNSAGDGLQPNGKAGSGTGT